MEDKLNTLIERSEELIKKNEILVEEATKKLTRLGKILNNMLVIAGIVFIPFLYSFIDLHSSVRYLSKTSITQDKLQESEDEMYTKFVQKVDALAVHMFEHDWTRTQLYKISQDESYGRSGNEDVKNVLRAFFDTQHRSNETNKDR